MGYDLERDHAMIVRQLAVFPRGDLWQRLGFDGPLTREQARTWIGEQARIQRIAGDRVRLHLPPDLMPAVPDFGATPGEPWPFARGQGEMHPVRIYHSNVTAIDTWAGRYLRDDLTDGGPGSFYPGSYPGASVQPLALVALAAVHVARATGCDAGEATAWLLCDESIPAREMVARFHTGTSRGVSIWVADWQINARELGRSFARQRQWLTNVEQRSRRPLEQTMRLIEYVERVRPHKGKHVDNMEWSEMVTEWNNAQPEAWHHKDSETMQRAYRNARKRRERLGILPPKEKEG